MSLEEERARQAASASTPPVTIGAGSATLPSISEASASVPTPPSAPPVDVVPASHSTIDADDEEALLAQALALSQQTGEDVDMKDPSSSKGSSSTDPTGVPDDEEMSEEEAIAKAIAMSMQEDQEGAK